MALYPKTTIVTKGTVIQDVTVVNTRDGTLQHEMAIHINDGRIEKIAKNESIRSDETVQTVKAAGKFVVPGFLDMHTHAMNTFGLPVTDRLNTYALMIANGITGFREMEGSTELIAEGKALNQGIAAGTIVAPELLLIPGEIISSTPMNIPGKNTVEEAVKKVSQHKAYGAQFIKVVGLKHDALMAVLDAAGKLGIDVAGHIEPDTGAIEVSNAGMKAIEHLGPFLAVSLDCSTSETDIRQKMAQAAKASPPRPPAGPPPTLEMINRMLTSPMLYRVLMGIDISTIPKLVMATYSEEKALDVAKVFGKNKTWQVPTLIRIRTMQVFDDPIYRNDPHLKYVAPETRAMWEELAKAWVEKVPEDTKGTLKRFYGLQLKLLKLFKQAGVKMVAGSDFPGGWCIPGFSLQQEFRELSNAGMSPLEILQMTTLNGAEFLNREATMGTVDEGKNADLVLLDANPIDNVENLSKIHAVVLKGRYYSKATLEKMKQNVETVYKENNRI